MAAEFNQEYNKVYRDFISIPRQLSVNVNYYKFWMSWREKEADLTQSYDNNPYTNRKFKNQWTNKNATKNFDYTTIADRLRTVSLSNNSHPTGVVTPFTGAQPSH